MSLTFGSDRVERVVDDAAALLLAYRDDSGADYLDFKPSTPKDVLLPEDLAVTILINSRVGPRAFQAVQQHGQDLDLPSVPSVPLEDSSDQDRIEVSIFRKPLDPYLGIRRSWSPSSTPSHSRTSCR